MKIKKLRLKNGYKRFHDLTIDLGNRPKRIVALVGPNGSGKSSVLDGMVFKQIHYHGIGDTGGRDHRYHSKDSNREIDSDSVSIDFLEGTFQEVISQKHGAGKGGTLFSFRSPYRYNSVLNVSQISAVPPINQNGYGASCAADLDAKIEQNYRRLNIAYNKYMNSADVRPSEAKSKIIGDLNRSLENCLDLKITSLGDVESSRGTIFFSKSDQNVDFPFDVLSSGEKEVVDILLDLYLRKEEYNDTIFLFDEPELHINTSIQKSLLIEINRLVPENCQIWITTHSIGFLRALQGEFKSDCQVIHFKKGLKFGEEEITLTPLKSSHAEWREIFSIALDDLVQLVSPRRIIYCEGRDAPGVGGRDRGLDAQVYNTIFASEFPDTLFVSSGGNTELDQRSAIAIAIIGKALPDLEIWVLKDRDMASGRHPTETDRNTYLSLNGENHRVLRRFEIENYLFDQEVLKGFCVSQGNGFDQAAYDAHVTDTTNQNLKDDFNRIKSICGVITNVNAERFKLALAAFITPDTEVYNDLKASIFERQ